MKSLLFVLLTALLISSCSDSDTDPKLENSRALAKVTPIDSTTKFVREGDRLIVNPIAFGNDYPFTQREGYITCDQANGVVFHSANTAYPLNGAAREAFKKAGRDPDIIREIWLDNENGMGMKKSIEAFITEGLKLCK